MGEHKTSEVFLRPRFQMDVDVDSEKLKETFTLSLNDANCKYPSKISDNHFFIDIPEEESHFWSPQLNIEIVKDENDKTLLKGLFGPKPKVWTLFMFLHFVGAIFFIIALVLLYVKWILDKSLLFPTIIVIMTPIIWFSLYFIGLLGRKKGRSQMEELHQFMITILEK